MAVHRLVPLLAAEPRWVLPLVLWFGPSCDDQGAGQAVARAAARQLQVVPPIVPARERGEEDLHERMLEFEARLDQHFARLAKLAAPELRLNVESDRMRLDGKRVEQTRLAQSLRERVVSAKPTELALAVQFESALPQARVEEILDDAMEAGVTMYSVTVLELCGLSISGRRCSCAEFPPTARWPPRWIGTARVDLP